VTETVTARDGQMTSPATLAGRPAAGPASTVALVGAGRAGGALAVALAAAGHPVVAITGRDPGRAAALAGRVGARPVSTALAAIRAADLTFLTVPDSAVTPVATSIAATGADLRGRGIVHCSASLGIEAVAALRSAGAAVGCLHPLQALAGAESAPLLRGALFAIDADPVLAAPLRQIALDIGGVPVTLPGGARPLYHAAAVLAGNAPLALVGAATELLVAAGLDPSTAEQGLLALMEGAIANARRLGSRQALTGPVERGDTATVARHLAALKDRPDADALYRAVAREIVRLAGAEGREQITDMLDAKQQGDVGVRAERRFATGAGRNRAETRAPSAGQGDRTPGPARHTTPTSPLSPEDSTCP